MKWRYAVPVMFLLGVAVVVTNPEWSLSPLGIGEIFGAGLGSILAGSLLPVLVWAALSRFNANHSGVTANISILLSAIVAAFSFFGAGL